MNSDDPSYAATYQQRPKRRLAIFFVLMAFVGGLAAASFVILQYRQWFPSTVAPARSSTPGSTVAPAGQIFMPPPEVGSTAANIDTDTLNAREVALAAELAMLESRASVVDRETQLAAGNAGRAEAMLVAFAVRRAIDRGNPLGYLEEQLRARFVGQAAAVAILLRAGKEPVTIEDLRQQLDAIGPELTSGASKDGWLASLRREISSLIVIRRDGTPSPRAADRFVRVKHLLDAGRVEPALSEVARMPGAAQANRWIAAAKRFLEAQRALDTIESSAILGMNGTNQSNATAAAAPDAAAPSTR